MCSYWYCNTQTQNCVQACEPSSRKICLRLWKDMCNYLLSCGIKFLERFPQNLLSEASLSIFFMIKCIKNMKYHAKNCLNFAEAGRLLIFACGRIYRIPCLAIPYLVLVLYCKTKRLVLFILAEDPIMHEWKSS